MIPATTLRHSRMVFFGCADRFKALDFACLLEGKTPGQGGTDQTSRIADQLIEVFDIYLGGANEKSIGQVTGEFRRANYLGAEALLKRNAPGPGRPAMPHVVAYLAAFRALLESINPTWRLMGWTVYAGREVEDEAKEAAWLLDALGDDMEAGIAPPLKGHKGAERSLTSFEQVAAIWLRWNDRDVTWSRGITEKAKRLHRLNLRNRLQRRATRGNHGRRSLPN